MNTENTTYTFRQIAVNSRYDLTTLFDKVDDLSVYLGYNKGWTLEEKAGLIPYACIGHSDDMLFEANYKAITEEYKDLIDDGIICQNDSSLYVYLDRPYHDDYRLMGLLEMLENLRNDPVVDEELFSNMEFEAQQEFITSELRSFINELDVHPDLEFLFDQDLVNLENHIWQLIRDNDLEFEMTDSAWIDIEAIAKLSPMYRMGHKAIDEMTAKLDEISDKLETTINFPTGSLFSTLSAILSDIQSVASGNQVEDSIRYY